MKRLFTNIKKLTLLLPLLILQNCNLYNEEVITPLLPEPETGMWLVGQYVTNGDARFVRGSIIGGNRYAFLTDAQKGLYIININDAANPVLIFNYVTSGYLKEVYIDSVSSNHYAFLSDAQKGLYVLNINNPAIPVLDTLIQYQGGVNSACIKDGHLYAALTQGSVKILSVQTLPDSVYEEGTYNSVSPVEHIETYNQTAFFVGSNRALEIVDISNPVSPVLLSTFNTPGQCYDLKIADNLIYVADGTSGVSVVNVGNPSQPYLVSLTNTYSDVRGIDYSPNFMFTAEYNEGAEVFNLFNPSYPEAFGYYIPTGFCYSVHYFKGKVLIANGQNGLLILRF